MQQKERKKERKEVSAPRKIRYAEKMSLGDFEKCLAHRIILKHYNLSRNSNFAQTSSLRKKIVFHNQSKTPR
jgi:hypothetical protein